MALFEWLDEYAVGVGFMDQDHKEVMGLALDLESAVAAGAPREELSAKLSAAVSAAEAHMVREEAILKQAGYPYLALHKREHEDLLRTLLEFQLKVADGSATLCVSVLEFLKGWMGSHLRSEDRRAAQFLRQCEPAKVS